MQSFRLIVRPACRGSQSSWSSQCLVVSLVRRADQSPRQSRTRGPSRRPGAVWTKHGPGLRERVVNDDQYTRAAQRAEDREPGDTDEIVREVQKGML